MRSVWLILLLSITAFGQTPQNQVTNQSTILVQDVVLTGVQNIGTAELNEITGTLTGSKFADDKEEIGERLRFAFQNHGFFDAKVTAVRIKVADPLANPKPVTVEADVSQGQRFRVGDVLFRGNSAVTSEVLRARFPIKPNETFTRDRIASGLMSLRDAYVRLGYIDFYAIPETPRKAANKIDVEIAVHEGKQYVLGTLMFTGNPELTQKLRPRWELEFGQPYDGTYIEKFIEENKSLMPANFSESQSVKTARDCREQTVTVMLDLDPEHPTARVPRDSGCEPAKDAAK